MRESPAEREPRMYRAFLAALLASLSVASSAGAVTIDALFFQQTFPGLPIVVDYHPLPHNLRFVLFPDRYLLSDGKLVVAGANGTGTAPVLSSVATSLDEVRAEFDRD